MRTIGRLLLPVLVVTCLTGFTDEDRARRVTIDPNVDLVDGQRVTVVGTGFQPGQYLEIFECRADAVDIGGCDAENAYDWDADPSGTVTFYFPGVDARIYDESGQKFDCRSAPNACKIGVGYMLDFSHSAFATLDFAPDAPLLPRPAMTVKPTGPYADGQNVEVLVKHVSPLFETFAFQCVAGRPMTGEFCDFSLDARGQPDDRWRVRIAYAVSRTLHPSWGGNVDCGEQPGRCELRASQGFSTAPDRVDVSRLSFA